MSRSLVIATAAVLWLVALPAGAMATGFSDACGPGVPDTSQGGSDPTIPWLDICSGTITSVADANGAMPTLRAELRLAGDPNMREGLGAYRMGWSAAGCTMTLLADDRGPVDGGFFARVKSSCDATFEPCDLPLNLPVVCAQLVQGSQFEEALPTSAVHFTSSSIIFEWDPDTWTGDKRAVAGMQSGSTLSHLTASTLVRAPVGVQDSGGQYVLADSAFGEQPHQIPPAAQ